MVVPHLVETAGPTRRAEFEDSLRPLIPAAYRVAFAHLRDRGQAEDAVQEACLKAWRGFARLREPERALRPWFFKIVTNECRMVRRTRWWQVLKLDEIRLPQLGSTEDLAGRRLDLGAAIARLGPEQRLLLFLYFALDLPFEEIGPVVGISARAAKARLYRVTRGLRPGLLETEVFS